MGRWHEAVAKRKLFVEIIGSIDLEEASHETFVLEACSVKFRGSLARILRFWKLCSMKFGGSLARNARFETFLKWTKGSVHSIDSFRDVIS